MLNVSSHPSVTVSSPEIPNVDVLLHADCNEQEVMCEISHYTPRGSEESSDVTYFMVSLNVKEVNFRTVLIMQTLAVKKDESTLIQNKLGLPLSQSGTLLTEGEMQSLISSSIFLNNLNLFSSNSGLTGFSPLFSLLSAPQLYSWCFPT